jgi:hypothetical protein
MLKPSDRPEGKFLLTTKKKIVYNAGRRGKGFTVGITREANQAQEVMEDSMIPRASRTKATSRILLHSSSS